MIDMCIIYAKFTSNKYNKISGDFFEKTKKK